MIFFCISAIPDSCWSFKFNFNSSTFQESVQNRNECLPEAAETDSTLWCKLLYLICSSGAKMCLIDPIKHWFDPLESKCSKISQNLVALFSVIHFSGHCLIVIMLDWHVVFGWGDNEVNCMSDTAPPNSKPAQEAHAHPHATHPVLSLMQNATSPPASPPFIVPE